MEDVTHHTGFAFAIFTPGGVLLSLTLLTLLVYNAFLHPLRHYPGPKLWSSTRLIWTFHDLTGTLPFTLASLHAHYGPVIRVAPNELSYTAAGAWRDIYGPRSDIAPSPSLIGLPHAVTEMGKDLRGVGLPPPLAGEGPGIANAGDKATHARFRKRLAPAFSERAMRLYHEPVLRQHVTRLVTGLRRRAALGEPVNIVHWLNWMSFDVAGDLTFGSDVFQSLETEGYHPWVANIFRAIKSFAWLHAAMWFGFMPLLRWITPKTLTQAYDETLDLVRKEVDRRIDGEGSVGKPNEEGNGGKKGRIGDVVSYLDGTHRDGDSTGKTIGSASESLTRQEIYMNSAHVISAGSETTATALSGAIYLLLRHQHVYHKLNDAVRGAFKHQDQITLQSTLEVPYLTAVIEESMRIYPPSAGSLPRMVPGKGALIDGKWVPGGTTVSVHQFATYQSPSNFHDPHSFVPERWLPPTDPTVPSRYANDIRAAFNPFSYGPRNCVGKSLAYAEMRLALAHIVYNFDLRLADEGEEDEEVRKGRGWTVQKAYLAWEKPPLMIVLAARSVE